MVGTGTSRENNSRLKRAQQWVVVIGRGGCGLRWWWWTIVEEVVVEEKVEVTDDGWRGLPVTAHGGCGNG